MTKKTNINFPLELINTEVVSLGKQDRKKRPAYSVSNK